MKAPNIIYEDNHVIIADKPAGILTQGDYSGETSLLEIIREYIRIKFDKPGEAFIGLVHRLDRPVSGLLVFARTSKAASRLQKEFISGDIKKFYIAVIENDRESRDIKVQWNRLENFLERERDTTHITSRETNRSEKGILHYYPLLQFERYTMVLIKLDTGKKHQIRAQFSGIGKPIAGDKKYGSKTDTGDSILLHSVYLSFVHPTKREIIQFYSPPPHLFEKFIAFNKKELAEKIKILADNFPLMREYQS